MFPKPIGLYIALSVFGKNIVASEGEDWKKIRKIVAPTFSEVRFVTSSLPMEGERDRSEK
jgi:cytochrome P450